MTAAAMMLQAGTMRARHHRGPGAALALLVVVGLVELLPEVECLRRAPGMTKEERLLATVEKNLHMEETTQLGEKGPEEPDGPDTQGYMHAAEQHQVMVESEGLAQQVLAKLTDQHINEQMRDPKISTEQKERVKKYRAQELKKAKFALKAAQAPKSEKTEQYITTMQQGADLVRAWC